MIIERRSAAEVYMTGIEHTLLSRLDHAAYLGRELARAEHALLSGEPYVQDAAPEQRSSQCSCHLQPSEDY
jgi:tetrahydromethanopterin S-methyltransferase subunit A